MAENENPLFDAQKQIASGVRVITSEFCGEDENEEICRVQHVAMLIALSIREGVDRGVLLRGDSHDDAKAILHAIARRLT